MKKKDIIAFCCMIGYMMVVFIGLVLYFQSGNTMANQSYEHANSVSQQKETSDDQLLLIDRFYYDECVMITNIK